MGFLATRLSEGPKNQQSVDCCLLKMARDQKWDENLIRERPDPYSSRISSRR